MVIEDAALLNRRVTLMTPAALFSRRLHGVTAIAAGYGHSLFIKSDGSLWAMGADELGELGDGAYVPGQSGIDQPEKIVPSGVTAIAAGTSFSLFIKSDGSLWAMGDNEHGQLGDSSIYYATNLPVEIVNSNVIAVAAGFHHSLFLKSDGSVWGMGYNLYGQLGDGTSDYGFEAGEIVSSNVVAIAAGGNFSLFLKSDGSLWGTGDNEYGQLGFGDGIDLVAYQPLEIVPGNVTAMTAGAEHTLFIKSDGSLWGMGYDLVGQLGDGFHDDELSAVDFSPEQIFPLPQPVLQEAISLGTNLEFTATCPFGGNYYLLASTNLSQPLAQWTPVWTNSITSRIYNTFTAMLTGADIAGSQQFYILQSH